LSCPNCGTAVRAGKKFCPQCASPLSAACSSCGAVVEASDRFCGECASPLGGEQTAGTVEPTAPVAERRLVSVLFADLVGFTTASEDQDPETVRDFLTLYFDTAREVIERYGGTVEKFIGDAVMALWGAPTAHEDDAERAVRAALDLVEAVAHIETPSGPSRPQLRAAVLTGEAAVTLGAEGHGMVAGDLVNTASRLQSAASAGTVFVGEATYRAAEQAVAFEPVGGQILKGKQLPVPAWQALRVVAKVRGVGRAERLEAPFVGRDDELRLVKDLFHATAREGKARLLSVIGQAGLGKSRLVWEFLKYIDGLVETVLWHQGRSPAYGEGITFWALGEMVRKRASIAETDDEPTSRQKLTDTLDRYVPDIQDRRWIGPSLAALLGLEDAPSVQREELFAAWRTFFERVSDQGSTVMVFDDLHWADSGLIDFIEHLLEWSRGRPIFVVTLARPEFLERRPNWGAGQRSFSSLHLDPLTDDDMVRLLDGLAPGLPGKPILRRAEGVPLYAVETVRMLIDNGRLVLKEGSYQLTGDVDLAVPESLQGLIAARLDGLAAPERALLQDAAVLGESFTISGLAALTGEQAGVLEPRLKDLVRRELLRLELDPLEPERGQYQFVQALIRDVAHSTLSRRDRKARHLAAARYFETLGDDELAGVLASHYLEAYRASPEGPEAEAMAAQARVALRAAAERAAALHSHEQAIAFYDEALTVTREPAQRAAICERAGWSAYLSAQNPKAQQYLSEAVNIYGERGDKLALARATARLGQCLVSVGQASVSIRTLEAALAKMTGLEDHPEVVELTAELARDYMMHADFERAVEFADRTPVAAEQLALLPTVGEALITKGTSLANTGRFQEGIALMRGALALGEANGLPLVENRASNNISSLLVFEDPRAGFEVARTGLERFIKLGHRDGAIWLTGNLLECALWTGDWDAALEARAQLYVDDLAAGYRLLLAPTAHAIRALRGDIDDAKRELAADEELAATITDPQHFGNIRLCKAIVQLADGRPDLAYECATAPISSSYAADGAAVIAAHAGVWLRDSQRLSAALEALESRSGLTGWREASRRALRAARAALEGRLEEAATVYREASDKWRQLDAILNLGICQMERALLLPEHPDAEAAGREAHEIFTRLGSPPLLARLEEGLQSPAALAEAQSSVKLSR
jgi:class 3 adenylate cyclase/tetratricopeptide (TPR) repeat protein